MNSQSVEEKVVDEYLENPPRNLSNTESSKIGELLENTKANSNKLLTTNGTRSSNTKRKPTIVTIEDDEEILFDSPPTKSKREDTSLSEIPPNEQYKILTVLSGILLLKLCKNCQSKFICNKSRFRFQDGRILCSVDLCANCSVGNIRAKECTKEPRQIYESDYFKLAKIEYGVIIAKLCHKCEQHLSVKSLASNDECSRIEVGFCRSCAQNNMNSCDALTKFFPYTKKQQ